MSSVHPNLPFDDDTMVLLSRAYLESWYELEAAKVLEHVGDQLAPARISSGRGRLKEAEQIASLVGGLGPCARRRGQKLRFELDLPLPQGLRIGLDAGDKPPNLGGLLGRHAAVLIKLDGLLRHHCAFEKPIG